MRIVKVGVLAPANKGIPLGVQGESCATEVEFDVRPWFREYPFGTVSAVAKREGDPAPYPLSLDVADGTAVWAVTDTDTARPGTGAVELTMTSGGTRVRSLTFKTSVTASLTDAPVGDDAWYGWLDKAVVKVDRTVQAAQGKMAEVDEEWTGLKVDVTAKVDECGEVAAQAAKDAHHAKVDAQATAKALESAEGSAAKAEAAANRAVDAALAADDSAVEASNSALSSRESKEAASGSATNAATSASDAAASASSAAASATAAEKRASDAAASASEAATSAQEAKDAAGNAASEVLAATKANADSAAKSATDAAASVGAINVIAPKVVGEAASTPNDKSVAIGYGASCPGTDSAKVAVGVDANASGMCACAIGPVTGAVGVCAVAEGLYANAIGDYGVAIGANVLAAGNRATAINSYAQALGLGAIAISNAYTLGKTSAAIGYLSSTAASQSVAIGTAAVVSANTPDADTEAYNAKSINSVALGAFSYTDEPNVVSVGNDKDSFDRWKRVITNEGGSPATPSTTPPFWEKKTTNYPASAKRLKRRITNVADPFDWHNAANKHYVDRTTSNALVGTVSGKLLHVEDAWPFPLLSVTIDGAYRQDGTPSPDSPVPITVVENPVIKVTGRNLIDLPDMTVPVDDNNGVLFDCGLIPNGTTAYISVVSSNASTSKFNDAATCGLSDGTNTVYSVHPDNVAKGINRATITPTFDATKHLRFFGYRKASPSFDLSNYQLEVGGYHDYRPYTSQSLPVTLPAEHPYLAALPDGTHDEIVIDKDGNVSLVARVGKVLAATQNISFYSDAATAYVVLKLNTLPSNDKVLLCNTHKPVVYSEASGTIYSPDKDNCVIRDSRFTSLDAAKEVIADTVLYYYMPNSVTYPLGKLDVPSLPETISNVWTEAGLTANMSMTYKRDINIAFDNLVQAVVAAAAGE